MIPSVDQVAAAHAWAARRFSLSGVRSDAAIRAALALASELALSPDEDAVALLYAFGRYPRAFADGWRVVTALLVQNAAAYCGRSLRLNADELRALLVGVASGHIDVDGVRTWLRARSSLRGLP